MAQHRGQYHAGPNAPPLVPFTHNEDFSSLPEVVDDSQGRCTGASRFSSYPGMEVKRPEGKERAEDFAYGIPMAPNGYLDSGDAFGAQPPQQNLSSRENTFRIARRICAVLVVVTILALALGLGLGLGLNPDKSSSPESAPASSKPPQSTTSADPKYLSRRGAFNGTGISVMQQPYWTNLTLATSQSGAKEDGNLLLIFQHHTGDIRWMARDKAGVWTGGSRYDIVARDAKNATPITLLGAGPNGLMQHHVFYIGNDGFAKQRVIDNMTYTWHDGPLNNKNVKAFDAERIGLQACFYQGPIAGVDLNGTDPTSGIRIFMATSETTFDQYAWRSGLESWVKEQSSWDSVNGHATPGCFGWSAGWTTYVMFVGIENDVQLWWRDTSYNVEGTSDHPLNTWVQAPTVFGSVDPSTGLSFHSNLYGKSLDSGQVQGWNITFSAENTTTGSTTLSNVFGDPAIVGSHLWTWTVPPTGEPNEVLVFYQTHGDDITVYSGNPSSGAWTPTTIPIPSD